MPETPDDHSVVPAESKSESDREQMMAAVREAVATIFLQRTRPSVAAVRAILGGGNQNTINDLLGEFYHDLGRQLREGRGSLPETGLPPAFLDGAKALYKVAADIASQTLARDREEAARQVAAAEEKQLAAERAQAQAEVRLATALKDIQRLDALTTDREQALGREIERAAEAGRHVAHLQTEMEARDRIAREQTQKLETRIHELDLEVATESARAERSESLLEQAKAGHARLLTQERAHYERQLSARAGSELLLRQQLDALRLQLQTAESARAELRGQLAGVRSQMAERQEERDALLADKERLLGEIAGAQATVAAIEKILAERAARIETLEQRVATLTEERERLQVRLARAGDNPNEKAHD